MNKKLSTIESRLSNIGRVRALMKRTLPLLAIVSIVVGNVETARGVDDFAWSSRCFQYSAVAMTPYNMSIQGNQYRQTHERVYHRPGATGLILLYGPADFRNLGGDGVRFSVTYKDPDGPGFNSRVHAELRHIGPNGIRIISRLDSNKEGHATNEIQTMSDPIEWRQLNQRKGFYVVRIYITRKDTTLVPSAFGYSLCGSIF